MVTTAPRFGEVAGTLAERLNGSVLVAHNLPFAERMLRAEFARLGVQPSFGAGIDTLRLSGRRLPDACAAYGVSHAQARRALGDARATAERLLALPGRHEHPAAQPFVTDTQLPLHARTLRREASGPGEVAGPPPYLAQLKGRLARESADATALRYVELLDWVRADPELDADARRALGDLADDLGLSPAQGIRRRHSRRPRPRHAAPGTPAQRNSSPVANPGTIGKRLDAGVVIGEASRRGSAGDESAARPRAAGLDQTEIAPLRDGGRPPHPAVGCGKRAQRDPWAVGLGHRPLPPRKGAPPPRGRPEDWRHTSRAPTRSWIAGENPSSCRSGAAAVPSGSPPCPSP